jgi:hypothetical protein
MARHIRLYVNEYTRALDEPPPHRLVDWATREGLFPAILCKVPSARWSVRWPCRG